MESVITSFDKDITYNSEKAETKVILETEFTKEIRILLKKGQRMKEHKAPFPIIIHVLKGEIVFGVNNEMTDLQTGDIITLGSSIPHDLFSLEDSVIRLTLSKLDKADRVKDVTK